jgi:hypothetical protein
MKMQRHGRLPATAINTTRSKESGPAGGMAERTLRSREIAANKWKQGEAEAKAAGDHLYLLFDWDSGVRRGLIDAHREGTRLVGKYINLTDPKVTRPWIGLIVSNQRIDGRWTGGRLDFRR